MSHTPGSWIQYGNKVGVVDWDGDKILEICTCAERSIISDKYEVINNARLIAAAPDLLAAAKRLMPIIGSCWYGGNGCKDEYCGYCQLEKAIAKAEGRL